MLGVQSLCLAIEKHNNKEAERLINEGVCVYRPVKSGDTPLFHAMVHENEELAHILSKCYERDMRVVWAGRKDYQPVLVAHGRYQVARTRDMAEAMLLNTSESDDDEDGLGGRTTKSRIDDKKVPKL